MIVYIAKSTIGKSVKMSVQQIPRKGETIVFDDWDDDDDVINSKKAIVEDVIHCSKPLTFDIEEVYQVLVIIKSIDKCSSKERL